MKTPTSRPGQPIPTTNRSGAHAHAVVYQAGAEAAQRGDGLHTCPYKGAAFRATWLRGYQEAQQLTLNL
jgi:ribosome modulation factor